MNLIKLFNPAYLKENIKKSKGLIILFLILVPLFTALVTILSVLDSSSLNVFETIEVSLINIFGMYVIPFVLSFALFGYVYRKNSVDFINSMPINRKTIFVTNTIGGIILITLMQFLTAAILIICDLILVDLIIFPKMISDIFILMWVSYVFVFVATNLAMTLSGTFLTQIALTMLILFLVPFCTDSYNEFSDTIDYNFITEEGVFSDRVYEQGASYTMPYRLFSLAIIGNSDEIYSSNSIIRMSVLGILYFGIGLYLFQKRKMEDTEESFSSVKRHIGVKALTILPMVIVLNLAEPDIEFLIFAIALIGVYYFLFDFLVKRKVSLKVSIPSLIGILIVSQIICVGAEFIREESPVKELNKNDIKEISIANSRTYKGGSWYYYRDIFSKLDFYFGEEEIIDLIFNSAAYVQNMYNKDKIENGANAEIGEIYTNQVVVDEVKYDTVTVDEIYEPTALISVVLKTKSGKVLEVDLEILEADFNKLINILENNEKYAQMVREKFIHNGEYTIENILCNHEEQELIKNELKSKLENLPIKEIYTTLRDIDDCAVYEYTYEDHMLIRNTISVKISEKLFDFSIQKINKVAVEKVQKAMEEDVYRYFYVNISREEDQYYRSADFNEGVIENFILQNANEKVDYNKEYYILRGNMGTYGSICFYTNKIDEINQMIEINAQDFYNQVVY